MTFDRPLDHALLEHSLSVHGPSGQPLNGECVISSEERRWTFAPRKHWADSRYSIVVDSRLEDLAGNALSRVFDRDLTRPEDAPTAEGYVAVAFIPETRFGREDDPTLRDREGWAPSRAPSRPRQSGGYPG